MVWPVAMHLLAHPTFNIDFLHAVNLDETAVILAQNKKNALLFTTFFGRLRL
jgi:hypothetical protein